MSKKILIVEDNTKNRVLLRDVLQYHGYEVLEAADGEEGVRLAREHIPGLIFLDIQMPVMDGFSALKMLKATPETRSIRVIALTSFAMTGDREKILNAGFDHYLSKPINTRELPVVVKQYMEA
ncbi:MAG: response regulator [Thermodesulfovibrionales bacterium]|nr:MAG: response regulator [Nitrospirota bacterium]